MPVKASAWTRYGPPDVLQLQEVATPTPKDDEVLIKIHATGVTAGDCEMRRLKLPMGLSLPMRPYVGLSRPRRVTILGPSRGSAPLCRVGTENWQCCPRYVELLHS